MRKIYLFCSAGMSTSMLAANMQQVANERSLDIYVQAFPHDQLEEVIRAYHPDCILLGPQVNHLFEEIVKEFSRYRIPIGLIDSLDYGMLDGEKVLKSAIKLIRKAEELK